MCNLGNFIEKKLLDGFKNNWFLCYKNLIRLILIWVLFFIIYVVSKIFRFEMSLIVIEVEDKLLKLNLYLIFICEIYIFYL